MSDEICPLMSGPIKLPDGYREWYDVIEVPCIEDRCKMWKDTHCGFTR